MKRVHTNHVPTVVVGPCVDGDDQPGEFKRVGPSVLVTFEHVRYEDRKVLCRRLNKQNEPISCQAQLGENNDSILVVPSAGADWVEFEAQVFRAIREACASFNSKLAVVLPPEDVTEDGEA